MEISKGYVSDSRNYCLTRSLSRPKVNILIDDSAHARLTGFNMITIASDQSAMTSPTTAGGTIPWMSPELLYPERFGLKTSHPTKESDCYALGMVIYEVLSGRTPFAPRKDPEVVYMVLGGERPARPQGAEGEPFTDDIWEVLEKCWKSQRDCRPNAKAVLMGLQGNLSPLRSPSDTDGDMGLSADDQSDNAVSGPGTFSPFHSRHFFDHPCITIGQPNTRDGKELPDPPRTVSPKRGRFGVGIVRIVQKPFGAAKKVFGHSQDR